MFFYRWYSVIVMAALVVGATWLLHENASKSTLDSTTNKWKVTAAAAATTKSYRTDIRQEDGLVYPVAFPRWSSGLPLPCNPASRAWLRKQNEHVLMEHGLFYAKLYKCASTTSASVHLRIARNLAIKNGLSGTVCENFFGHNTAGRTDGQPPYGCATRYGQRDRNKSFLWTTVRKPTSRYVSQYFYSRISKRGMNYTDSGFLGFLDNQYTANTSYYLTSLNTQGHQPEVHDPVATIQQILSDYNFIGIVERFSESVVALMMIMGLDIGDVLFLDSKSHDGYADSSGFVHPGIKCFKVVDSHITPAVQEFFDTSENWKKTIYWDEVLYEAANKSLDITIDYLGHKEFQANLDLFTKASQLAHERCQGLAMFSCPPTKREMKCIGADIACGQQCLDSVVRDLGLGISFNVTSIENPVEFKTRLHSKLSSALSCRSSARGCSDSARTRQGEGATSDMNR